MKRFIWSIFLTALSLCLYYTFLVYIETGTLIETINKIFLILPLVITFILTYKLAEDFKMSLLYGILLGSVYVLTDTIMIRFYHLQTSYMQLNIIILFLVIFGVVGAIGSRFGIVKRALNEIKENN